MNGRRIELEKTLPGASKDFCDFVYGNLMEAGGRLSIEDMKLIGRLATAFFKTEAGLRVLFKLLGVEPKPASILKTYFKAGQGRHDSVRIKANELHELQCWIYKNKLVVPNEKIEVTDQEETETCASCGGRFPADYCTKQVELFDKSGHSRMDFVCNYCRAHSDQPRIRETGSGQRCMSCEKITCDYHPRHSELARPGSVVALLPAAQAERQMPNVPIPTAWGRI